MTEKGAELDDGELDGDDEDTLKDRYLTFQLGGEVYGVEIAYVIEIVGIQKITEVPDMPDYVKGVINLRGQVIPVIDVRRRFQMEAREYDDRTCIVVANIDETSLGLVVDIVREVLEIPAAQVSPPPRSSAGKGGSNRFLMGLGKVGEEVKILLDIRKFLFEEAGEGSGATAGG